MTETNQSSRANLAELKLPRRDWILLPLLGLLTLATILTSTELIARLVFPEAKSDLGKCLIEGSCAVIVIFRRRGRGGGGVAEGEHPVSGLIIIGCDHKPRHLLVRIGEFGRAIAILRRRLNGRECKSIGGNRNRRQHYCHC